MIGWRTWELLVNSSGQLQLQAPHARGSAVNDPPIVYREAQATHLGDRELCLIHLAMARSSTSVNPSTLEVRVTRTGCSCGLYCYTDFEQFARDGYLNTAHVSANVIPFGVVQMGADQLTLRTSDFLINRLIVHYGQTNVNGSHCTPQTANPHFDPWTRWVGEWVDPALVAYRNLCQELANQFEVQVDLAKPPELEAMDSFYPIQNPLASWEFGKVGTSTDA